MKLWKSRSVVMSMAIFIAAAGLATVLAAAVQSEDERVEDGQARLKAMQQEYVQVFRDREELLRVQHSAGRITEDAVLVATYDRLAAQLECAEKGGKRVPILVEMVEVAKQLEELAQAAADKPPRPNHDATAGQPAVGYVPPKALRLKTQIQLEEELLRFQGQGRGGTPAEPK